MPIRCLIVDDHTLFREGLKRVLESEPGIEVVGEARDASEAIERAMFLKPDVILLDIGMPGLSSFEASRRITRDMPGRRVIFLTMYEDEEYLEQDEEEREAAGRRGKLVVLAVMAGLVVAGLFLVHRLREASIIEDAVPRPKPIDPRRRLGPKRLGPGLRGEPHVIVSRHRRQHRM